MRRGFAAFVAIFPVLGRIDLNRESACELNRINIAAGDVGCSLRAGGPLQRRGPPAPMSDAFEIDMKMCRFGERRIGPATAGRAARPPGGPPAPGASPEHRTLPARGPRGAGRAGCAPDPSAAP
jgi:hypothetical protein